MTIEEEEHAAQILDGLPELPSSIGPGAAGLWAATILMKAATERGWPHADLADLLLTLAVWPIARQSTDEELHALLQKKIDGARAMRATKQ